MTVQFSGGSGATEIKNKEIGLELRGDGTLVCHQLCMLQAWVQIQARVIYFDSHLIFELKGV